MKTLAALIAGVILGGTGVGFAATSIGWKESKPGVYSCRGLVDKDWGAARCVSPKKDFQGGRYMVDVTASFVQVYYDHPKRGQGIVICRTGKIPEQGCIQTP